MQSPALPPIRGLLFDKDGTLLDYAASWLPVNRRAALMAAGGDAIQAARLLAAAGHDPASDRVAPGSLMVAGDAAGIAALWSSLTPGSDSGRLTEALDRLFEAAVAEAVAVPAMAEVLLQLHGRGYLLGLATSDSEVGARACLARFGVAEMFRYVAGWDSGHGRKPEAGMVHGFCGALGLDPLEVAVIGDSPQDMAMGRKAGAGLLLGVLTGTAVESDLRPPAQRVLPSIADLPALLAAQ